jgi:hypothetical protein
VRRLQQPCLRGLSESERGVLERRAAAAWRLAVVLPKTVGFLGRDDVRGRQGSTPVLSRRSRAGSDRVLGVDISRNDLSTKYPPMYKAPARNHEAAGYYAARRSTV